MEARFSTLQGTLEAMRPMSATGILFKLPTSEKVVAVVVDRNLPPPQIARLSQLTLERRRCRDSGS